MAYETLSVSEEIKLEQLNPLEADCLFGLIENDREYLSRFLPWPNETKTVNDSLDFIEQTIKLRQNGEEYGFGIKYNNKIIGHVSLMYLNTGRPEIGYWIASQYSGRGITTTAAAALTEFAHNLLNLKELTILANPDNIGSNRVAENLGYELNGTEISDTGETLNKWVSAK